MEKDLEEQIKNEFEKAVEAEINNHWSFVEEFMELRDNIIKLIKEHPCQRCKGKDIHD